MFNIYVIIPTTYGEAEHRFNIRFIIHGHKSPTDIKSTAPPKKPNLLHPWYKSISFFQIKYIWKVGKTPKFPLNEN